MFSNSISLAARACFAGVMVGAVAGRAGATTTAYAFTANATTSTLTYSFSANAPFAGTMIGANDPLQPANMQTRLRHFGFPCSFTATQNEMINISGSIGATGPATGAPTLHPTGTFKLGIDTVAGTSTLQDLSVNLVGTGSLDTTANLNNFTYQSFCAINPSCTGLFLTPISLPLGNASVTSLLAAQTPATPESGTLAAAGANQWNFSVPCTLTVTPTLNFAGSPIAADPQTVPAVFAGTITVAGATATMTGSATINYAPPTNTTPAPQPPSPMTVPSTSPLCPGINLILSITINSTTVVSNNTASLAASGTKIACRCDTNANGGLDVQDIFDFLGLWFANSPQADFNGGGISVQDIFDFLACWFARPLGC